MFKKFTSGDISFFNNGLSRPSISVLEILFSAKSAYYVQICKIVLESKGNKWRMAERIMVIDAVFFGSLTVLFFFGVLWGIRKAHSFEQEVAWSQRKE